MCVCVCVCVKCLKETRHNHSIRTEPALMFVLKTEYEMNETLLCLDHTHILS